MYKVKFVREEVTNTDPTFSLKSCASGDFGRYQSPVYRDNYYPTGKGFIIFCWNNSKLLFIMYKVKFVREEVTNTDYSRYIMEGLLWHEKR